MIDRSRLGPVFVYDMLSLARRWQVYAGRSAFVLFLLFGMTIAWLMTDWVDLSNGTTPTIAELAAIGEMFFYALAGIQISFILLAAPAAAAGSICIDRARGTLLHMMVTDLSDAEIVLGRLGSRLAPVFGFVACGVPVAALSGLLGGIDFEALLGLFIVSIALAILGCSLALAISIKASKTHEVLMAVYLIFGLWLLSLPIWWAFSSPRIAGPPEWFQKLNPFELVYDPYTNPGFAGTLDFLIFFAVALVVSAGLVGWSIWRLRRAVIDSTSRGERLPRRTSWIAKIFPSISGPTLDGNPVLWREWHRNRPSRLARWLWRGLYFVTGAMVAWGILEMIFVGEVMGDGVLDLGLGILLFFGLLMVAATSPTALAEERTRGSLDILLSTPMSTRSIVLAKWWGAYRTVLALGILPIFVVIFLAAACTDVPNLGAVGMTFPHVPVKPIDRFIAPACFLADFLASGALIVSIGLLLATWISRVGRAIGASVVIYVTLGIGWPFLGILFIETFGSTQIFGVDIDFQITMNVITSLSPAFGSLMSIDALNGYITNPRSWLWTGLSIVILLKLGSAGSILLLTLGTFNRCLGRVVESRPSSFRPATGPRPARLWKRKADRSPKPALVAISDSPLPPP
jgi:ABC-type transport system involved in multi-copper enzyme maturation permease subunit